MSIISSAVGVKEEKGTYSCDFTVLYLLAQLAQLGAATCIAELANRREPAAKLLAVGERQ